MKINLRESLNKIDLATNNKYDLLNTFNSKKLSDNSKKKLAEAIENNSIASINRVLHESEEQLFKVVIQSGATKRDFESALYEDEAEEIVDYYGGRWIDENGFEWNMYVEEDDDSSEHSVVDDSYDMEDDERAQRECIESLNEDLSSVKEIKQLDFTNNRVNNLRGIFSTKSFVKALNAIGLDKFKIRTSRLKNVSSGDLKDAWYDLKRNGWMMSIERDPSLSGFNEVYVFEKITNESLNEKLDFFDIEDKIPEKLLNDQIVQGDVFTGFRFNSEESANKFADYLEKKGFIVDQSEVNDPYYKGYPYKVSVYDEIDGKYFDDDSEIDDQLTEASYGGAYDIEDDMFFTKEDIVEFADNICEYLGDVFGYQYGINNIYMDGPRKLYINIYDNNYIEIESTFNIDMRKIRKPSDLFKVYGLTIENWFQKAFAREYRDAGLDESLTETNHIDKVNEPLNEQKYSSGNYFLTVDETGMGPHYSLYYQHPYSGYDGLKFIVDGYGYDNFKEKLSKFSTVYPNKDVQNLLRSIKKYVSGKEESLKEQINLPGYAVKYTTGYSGNGVNSGKTEWFRTEEERDRRVKELKDKNYTEIKTWEMDNFYHTLPKEECLEESNMSYVKKAFAFDIYKDGDKYVLVNGDGDTVYKSDNTLDCLKWAKKNSSKGYDFNNKFDFSRLKESLNEAYDKLFGYNMLSSTLKDGGDTYALLRKTEDGKTKWAAAKYVNGIPDEDNIFEITYEQARGFEPLTDTGKMSRKLGKALLPKKENLKEDYDEDVKKVKELIKDANSAFKIATNLIYFIDDNNSLSSLGYEALEMLKDVNKTKYRELLKSISSDIDEEDLRDYGTRDSGILDLLYDSHPIQEYIDSALNYILASKNSKKNDYIKKLASNIIDEVEEDELARFINDDLGDSSDASLKTSDSKSDDNIVYGIKVVFTEDTNDVKKGSWYIKGTGFEPIARDTTLIKDNQRFKHSYLKDKDFLKYYAYKTKKDAIKEVKNMSRYYQNGEDISIVEINLNDIDESLKEDLSDLDLILNTPVDTKQFNEEIFRALKTLVSEYKKDLDSLDKWAPEYEKEKFVKKWYKLADKCKEIAKNGIRGITGYGRLNDFIKLKIVDLARSVDNTFPWYTRNNLAKFNKLESLQEKLNNNEKNTIIKSIINAEEDELQKIVNEVYFYDRALYLKLRHFVKKNSLNDKKDYLIKVLQDSLEESLTEDTVKQNGKWVNKGSEGTHGKFRTKKAADAQRKAMFANGYKSESLKEAIDDEIDLDYEADFDDDGVEEGNTFVEGGVEYAWIQREAGPIYLDFDKWSVWSAREYVDPRDFMVIEPDGKEYKFDGDAFKEKAMAAPITYFVVEEDTGFIDWGPEDNEIAAKDFLNGKKEDWENDMDESLNEDKELNEYYIVNLHYEDIGDGREYDYEADYDDVLEYLMEICVDDDNAPEDTQEYIDWVEANFDYLLKKYEYRVLNYFEEDASQEEYDRRHSSYEPEYDPMD